MEEGLRHSTGLYWPFCSPHQWTSRAVHPSPMSMSSVLSPRLLRPEASGALIASEPRFPEKRKGVPLWYVQLSLDRIGPIVGRYQPVRPVPAGQEGDQNKILGTTKVRPA